MATGRPILTTIGQVLDRGLVTRKVIGSRIRDVWGRMDLLGPSGEGCVGGGDSSATGVIYSNYSRSCPWPAERAQGT